MEKLVLIDGNSILNRAFYGLPELTNSEGLHTNAIYGFLNILTKILEEEQPEYLTVAFDLKAPTFRHLIYSEYKGTRKPMADELREQVPVIKEVLKAMNIKIVEMEGFEADDILGTLAKKAEKNGLKVALVSGDRDLLQIATDNIMIRIPKTKGGKTEIENYNTKDVIDYYKVDPVTFIDLKALMGDTADNIPGVPKIGEKTATELLVSYGSLDGVYENIDSITKKSVKETLISNKDLAYLSKTLATIKTDVAIDYEFEDARVSDLYTDEAYVWFKKLEFKNLLSRFETKIDYDEITGTFEFIDDYSKAKDFVGDITNNHEGIGVSLIYDNKSQNDLLGVSITTSNKSAFIKKWMFVTEEQIDELLRLIGSSKVHIYSKVIKKLYDRFNLYNPLRYDDVILEAYLINPLKSDYSLADIANEYLGMLIPDRNELFKKTSLADELEKNPDSFKVFACYESYICYKAAPILENKLKAIGEYELYTNIEKPLTLVLNGMEKEGIMVVPSKLKEYSLMLEKRIKELEDSIYEESGEIFNINSPKQLGEILFEKMNLPGGKKTKTGYSTAADVLEKLSEDYPFVSKILEYRAYTKLKSTYADGLTNYIDADNRIHTNFHQTITATGRLSSTEPNLQNIPIRMELGRQIRKVFVPKEGYVFVDADYSQIELRVLASLAGDQGLINAYKEEADIHRITASKVFKVPFDEVTDIQRRNAKAVNFGIVYGISAFGLGEDLGISQKEAKKYMEEYFATYPGIKIFLENGVKNAKEVGYTTTYFGRRRPIPELFSSNFMQRSFGERVAMNSPIQGTAADIIKIAMNNVYFRLKKENLRSKLILQIHDELLIEAAVDEVDTVKEILKQEMVNAVDLSVRLEIDMHTGNDWFEAK